MQRDDEPDDRDPPLERDIPDHKKDPLRGMFETVDKYWKKIMQIDHDIEKQTQFESLIEANKKQEVQKRLGFFTSDDFEQFEEIVDNDSQIKLKDRTQKYITTQQELSDEFLSDLSKSLNKSNLKQQEKHNYQRLFYNMLQDCLNLRKINVIGAKMKIYQERVRMSNYSELVDQIKSDNEQVYAEIFMKEEFNREVLQKC
jgi:hypothetical protein